VAPGGLPIFPPFLRASQSLLDMSAQQRLLPTPSSLSPSAHKFGRTVTGSVPQDSWQSRLSSPVCSLTRDIPQALNELHDLPVSDDCDLMSNPRLQLLLAIEDSSFLTNESWLRNNKSLDINHETFNQIKQLLRPFADEPEETAFMGTMILRQLASRRRICKGMSYSAYVIAAAFLAGKICEENDPKLSELIEESPVGANVHSQQVIAAERRLACELGWNFAFASPTELGFSLLDCLEGLKPSIKAALMQIVASVCYQFVFRLSCKPSIIVASVLTSLFTVLFRREAHRNKWASLFAHLITAPTHDVHELSLKLNPAIECQLSKILMKNNFAENK
jgi:hypothetical protein